MATTITVEVGEGEGDQEVRAVKSVPLAVVEKSVNCLFCYKPVSRYNGKQAKVERRLMVKTSERLFLYICKHLEIDSGDGEGSLHMTRKSKKEGECRLLPGNLPLCVKCKAIYYHKMYDAFVAYEVAIDKLSQQITACITSAIATSAKKNAQSVGERGIIGGGREDGTTAESLDDLITFQEASMNEHEVMKCVRQFRKKVADRNPTGYLDIFNEDAAEEQTVTGGEAASSSGNSSGNVRPTATIGVNSVINVVKTSTAEKLIKVPCEMQKLASERLREVKDEIEHNIPPSSSTKCKPLNYYAVANPSPGVIQIIPMKDPNPKKDSEKRRRREPEYLERRLQQNTCKFCNKYMPDRLTFKRHMVNEHGMEKPEKCPQCDFRTVEKSYLARHMETHLDDSERSKPYQCTQCGKAFAVKSSLTKHMENHTGNRQLYICEICGKQFKDSKSRQYCADKHNGVKSFECPFPDCDKRFLRKEVLKVHQRTHTGEKPFKCQVCGKCFSQRTPLTTHLKNVHNR